MGIKPASDIFQSRMVGVFQSMQVGRPIPYIDDVFLERIYVLLISFHRACPSCLIMFAYFYVVEFVKYVV